MTIKITKSGNGSIFMCCTTCECEFTFQRSDMISIPGHVSRVIDCPECGSCLSAFVGDDVSLLYLGKQMEVNDED